ncbi:MAG TPA: helix-turn-helix domain-containing protein, partial [Thermofilum sp.]|nr:helix-turn-helix domain-containing protein [Thermofilum sp.]
MRKWRGLFNISQMDIAERMNVSASVISDYESGRRKSPGSKFIKRFVDSLVQIDVERGRPALNTLLRLFLGSHKLYEAILDMREFSKPISIKEFCEKVGAKL